MLKNFLTIKDKRKSLTLPSKERKSKTVRTQRFNDMISYYTAELKSRIAEIERLKQENEMLIKTSLKAASRSDELRLQLRKTEEELRLLKEGQKR